MTIKKLRPDPIDLPLSGVDKIYPTYPIIFSKVLREKGLEKGKFWEVMGTYKDVQMPIVLKELGDKYGVTREDLERAVNEIRQNLQNDLYNINKGRK